LISGELNHIMGVEEEQASVVQEGIANVQKDSNYFYILFHTYIYV
jgi:hypothetical protein